MYESVRGNRTYGEFRRHLREVIPKSECRKLHVSLKRDGVLRVAERRRIISACAMLLTGVAQGSEAMDSEVLNLRRILDNSCDKERRELLIIRGWQLQRAEAQSEAQRNKLAQP